MKIWLGMGNGTLPGGVSLPDEEHPGAGNMRKRVKNRKPAIKKSPLSKRKTSPRKSSINKRQRTTTRKKK